MKWQPQALLMLCFFFYHIFSFTWYPMLSFHRRVEEVWEYFMFYRWVERFFGWRFNKQFLMAVYPFFKIQNYRQDKISGCISVICFTVRHKYRFFTVTKKRSVALEKKAFDLQFLKAKIFLQNSDPFLKGIRKWADLKNDSLSQMKDSCTTQSILDDWTPEILAQR